MEATCDHCGQPFTNDDPPIPMDITGSRMHARCGVASESGELPHRRQESVGPYQLLPSTTKLHNNHEEDKGN